MKVKAALLAVALSAGAVQSGFAADMPMKSAPAAVVAAAYDWSGIYVGGHIGWMRHKIDRTHFFGPAFENEYTTSSDDGIFGGHVGIQKQWGNWVLGVEAAASGGFSPLEGRTGQLAPPFNADLGHLNKLNALYTIGPRLGFASGRWMVFATGGLAAAQLKGQYYTVSTGFPTFLTTFSGTSRHYGWFAGAGAEYVVYEGQMADLIVGAEYQHFDLNKKRTFTETPVNGFDDSFDLKSHGDLVRARVTVKFKPIGWPR